MSKFFKGAAIGATMLSVALSMGTAHAQDSDSDTATAKAKILRKVQLTQVADLDFATIIAPPASGSATNVTMNSNGTLTCGTGAVCSGTAAAAEFDLKASKNQTLDVAIAGPTGGVISSVQGANTYTMAIDFAAAGANNPATVTTPTNGQATVNVGAVLTVGADQMDGDYEGDFTVTVSYN